MEVWSFQSAPWLEATENQVYAAATIALVKFQSAPWLEATENAVAMTAPASQPTSFNPLRGLRPRRTNRQRHAVPRPRRFNPLRGLRPRRTKSRVFVANIILFQSAPWLEATENVCFSDFILI